MIQKNPNYNIEVTLKQASELFRDGKDVLVCCEDERGIYAAQLISKALAGMNYLTQIPFDHLADAKFYIKEK